MGNFYKWMEMRGDKHKKQSAKRIQKAFKVQPKY